MKIIKLNAIDSTNDFLKELARDQDLDNFTAVRALEQTKGRGQMGSSWLSEVGKNLTFSVLIKNSLSSIDTVFILNMFVTNSILEALKKFDIPELSVKWPNDIMSGKKKIGGILIENLWHEGGSISSVVGIGLNVNQTNFEGLPKASSLKNCTSKDWDIDQILLGIIDELIKIESLNLEHEASSLKVIYLNSLFMYKKPSVFEEPLQQKFMGIIQDVSSDGLLEILLEDDTVKHYNIKEIIHHY